MQFCSPTLVELVVNICTFRVRSANDVTLKLVSDILRDMFKSKDQWNLSVRAEVELHSRMADIRCRPDYIADSTSYPSLQPPNVTQMKKVALEQETQGKRAGHYGTQGKHAGQHTAQFERQPLKAKIGIVRIGRDLFSLDNEERNNFVVGYNANSPELKNRLRRKWGFKTRRGVQLYHAALVQHRERSNGHRGRTRTRGGLPRIRSHSVDCRGKCLYWYGETSVPPRLRPVDFQ